MVFEKLLDPVLSPLLSLGTSWAVIILAFVITLLVTLAYKYLTNQEEMKRLKKELKEYQAKIKKLQKKDPKKAMAVQQQAMQLNMKYMKHSFKPTIYTFIPIIIIFSWMNAHLAYEPLLPGEQFSVTLEMLEGLPGNVTLESVPALEIQNPSQKAAKEVVWQVSGTKGEYNLVVKYGDAEFVKELIITDDHTYKPAMQSYDGTVEQISVGMKTVRPFGNISLFGWKPGWLGAYILLSIIFSTALRKAMKIS